MSLKTRTVPLITFLIAAPIFGEAGFRAQSTKGIRHQRNNPPSIESFKPSTFVLGLCPLFPEYYTIKLDVKASDSDGDVLTYRYLTSGGRIVGAGPSVDWDLRKTFGQQKVTVVVSDRRGGKSSSAVTVKVLEPISCDFPCPTLSVSCAAQINERAVGDFIAYISSSDRGITYLWSVTNGTIVGGRRKNTVRVRATGSAGNGITATVNVRGLDPSCNHQASCTTKIVKPIKQ